MPKRGQRLEQQKEDGANDSLLGLGSQKCHVMGLVVWLRWLLLRLRDGFGGYTTI